jgi:serine protease AprX
MSRRFPSTITVVLALAATSLTVAAAEARPAPDRASARGPAASRAEVDAAFGQRLRSAAAGERLTVVVTGLGAGAAERAVGGFEVRERLPLVDGFSATMTAGQARALARRPDVRRIEPVTMLHTMDDGTSRDFGVTAAVADRPGLDGSGVGICVIDTGIDPAHEQISPRTVTFRDFIGTGTTAYDDHGHGTHVASIAAGDGGGGSQAATFAGVAPAASLYAAKVLNAQGSGPNDAVAAGVQWCAAQPGVQVLSMSLGDSAGGDGTDVVSLAVNAAAAGGDVVVVAAGNGGDQPGTIASPGTATGALTVGAVSDHSNPIGTDRHDDGIWLAAFSSRGPTVDGRTKPDIAAPGVTVRAADAGTAAGYLTLSGTSMATPFVAGAVALGKEQVPGATPAQVRAAMTLTAKDVGAAGADNDYGAGLVDVRAFVDALASPAAARLTAFPTFTRLSGTVPTNGFVDLPIEVPAASVGQPLAATVTIAGQAVCSIFCLLIEWSPDLDVQLRRPDGTVAASSRCALEGLSCGIGRAEVVATRPSVAGTWTLRVYADTGSPNNGKGGSFAADVSLGPVVGSEPPPPPPANTPPVANAGPDFSVTAAKRGKLATVVLDGFRSTDLDGDPLGFTWRDSSGALVGSTSRVTLQRGIGTHTFTLTVTDGRGGTSTDSVTVTVRR